LFLLLGHDDQWARHDLPASMNGATNDLRMAADPAGVVIVSGSTIIRFTGEFNEPRSVQWSTGPWSSKPDKLSRNWMHCALTGTDMYWGIGAGEFGGKLWHVNTKTGHGEQIEVPGGGALPVLDLAIGPDGKIWELEGLAHFILRYGCIHVRSGDRWTRFCCSSDDPDSNWSLPLISFAALSFDSSDRPVVLSEDIGLIRCDDGKWSRLTPNWPEYLYVDTLLMIGDDRAIIGMERSGVAILNIRTGELRRFAVVQGKD
jgi:hypothetical protein